MCGLTHAMPNYMNFFYRIADQQSFMMVRSVHCERPLFLENRREKRKTSNRSGMTVSVTCERQGAIPRAAGDCLPTPVLLAARDRGIVARRSSYQSQVTLAPQRAHNLAE